MVASYVAWRADKYCTAAIPSIFTAMLVSAYLLMITLLAVKQEQGIW